MNSGSRPRGNGRNVSQENALLRRLARAEKLKRCVPKPIKRLVRRFLPYESLSRSLCKAADPYADAEQLSTYPAKADVRLGIIREFLHHHRYYVGACQELGVPYKLLDISGPDWFDVIKNSGCDAFLVRPSGSMTVWKQMYDERLKIMVQDLGKIIYPTYEEIWLYECKRRTYYWLMANNVPHPKTWVFYDRREALDFTRTAQLPIVFKSDLGAGASGVRIFRKRRPLRRFVNKCFKKGITRDHGDPRDNQWGTVLLQEYVPDAREWRMIRIGDSYFGYEKLKVGDFHSGSHSWRYSRPPENLLNLLRRVTKKGGFTSMDLDVLVAADGQHLISEMQTVFGVGHPYEMCVVDNKPGRMLYDPASHSWHFEAGSFCQNCLCNLRVEVLLKMMNIPVQSRT